MDCVAALDTYFGFNQDLFELAVGASLLAFSIGFGVGLVINTIRKARSF